MRHKLPEHLYLFGAGRWARVYLSVLKTLSCAPEHLTVISKSHGDVMQQWLDDQRINARITTALPDAIPDHSAAIVVNKACDHARAVSALLQKKVPTLVEKPMTLSASQTADLIEQAQVNETALAASNVFLFAPYMQRFKRLIGAVHDVTRITVTWEDPMSEHRYEEQKHYDDSINVMQDVFAHIYALLGYLWPKENIALLQVQRCENREASLLLSVGRASAEITLKRASDQRQRMICVESGDNRFVLDFAVEPGVVTSRQRHYIACPTWHCQPSPLTKQITCFLNGCLQGDVDGRLNPAAALASAKIVDQAQKNDL